MIYYLFTFIAGILAGMILFGLIENKQSLLNNLFIAEFERKKYKEELKRSEEYINALLDEQLAEGVIDGTEHLMRQYKRKWIKEQE